MCLYILFVLKISVYPWQNELVATLSSNKIKLIMLFIQWGRVNSVKHLLVQLCLFSYIGK